MYNQYIDHTLLKANATSKEIIKLCQEAKQYRFASVCVNPSYISLCKKYLQNTKVKICTVIGFPLGANTTETKVYETKNAIASGANEIDMVINISWLKDGLITKCINEVKVIKKACGKHILKVIVETALLTKQDKLNACFVVKRAKADFIKTSTGFSTSGAQKDDIILFRKNLPTTIHIKASGGIKTKETMLEMIKAGATRIGTSSGVELVK